MRTLIFLLLIPMMDFGQAQVAMPMGIPAGSRSVWVLSADNRLSQYDVSQWRLAKSISVPPDIRNYPEDILISSAGDVLISASGEEQSSLRRYTYTGLGMRTSFVAGAYERLPAKAGGFLVTSAKPVLAFSSDGKQLYWFEFRQQALEQQGERWRDAKFRAWSTDLHSSNPEEVAEFTFPRCACETLACSETCPEALAWTPDYGVNDFFFVTKWIEGQTESTVQETDVYQEKNGGWVSRKLPAPVEVILDAAQHGDMYVAADRDPGCCGWSNEGDDATWVANGATRVPVFDERQRFHNDNYDVSFFTANAAFSPNAKYVAYTISSTYIPSEELRLNSDGIDNPSELQTLKKDIAIMPTAEAKNILGSGVLLSLPHAEFVGWLDNARLLIVAGGELKIADIGTGKETTTGIKADAAKYVFLR